MRKETQEVRGLRRALAEAYLSERAARKKELVAVKAKEAALREMQATLVKRLDTLEAKTKNLDKWVKEFDNWRGTWEAGEEEEEDETLGAWVGCIEDDISRLQNRVSDTEFSLLQAEKNIRELKIKVQQL